MLSLVQNKYYIVRLGDFATNGNTKLLYGLFSILLCIDDYISRNSKDCFTKCRFYLNIILVVLYEWYSHNNFGKHEKIELIDSIIFFKFEIFFVRNLIVSTQFGLVLPI